MAGTQRTKQYWERIASKTSGDNTLHVIWPWQGNEKHLVRISVCLQRRKEQWIKSAEKEQRKEKAEREREELKTCPEAAASAGERGAVADKVLSSQMEEWRAERQIVGMTMVD